MKIKRTQDKISIIIIIIISILIAGLLSGCSSTLYKNKPVQITHVLAVTELGDTLKIPIESIKPNIVYNIIGYNYGRFNPYYRPFNYIYDYYPYNYSNITNNSSNSNSITTIRPTTLISTPSNTGSGTSGFSAKPPATNPVISGGAAKKKNKFNQ